MAPQITYLEREKNLLIIYFKIGNSKIFATKTVILYALKQ